MVRITTIATIVALALAAVLAVAGVGSDAWISVTVRGFTLKYGLFACKSNCVDWIRATQAFCVIGILELCAAILLAILFMFKETELIRKAIIVLPFVAAGSLLVGVIIYGVKSGADVSYLGGSYWVTVVSVAISLVAGGVAVTNKIT